MGRHMQLWFFLALCAGGLSFSPLAFAKAKHDYKDYKGEVKPLVCVTPVLKDGIYLGGGLGYDSYRITQNIDVVDVSGGVDQGNPTIKANGWLGNIFAGYGRYFDWFYIAGEIFANYSGANTNYSLVNYHSDFNVRESFGASILPGISIKKVALAYMRVGYVRSFFSAHENMPTLFNETTTSWGNGLQAGLGLEALVYKNLSMRGEYTYTSYSSFRTSLKTTFKPADNQLSFGVLYHFDYL